MSVTLPTITRPARRRGTVRELLPAEASAVSNALDAVIETIAGLQDELAADRADLGARVERMRAGDERRCDDLAFRLYRRIIAKRERIANLCAHAHELEHRLPADRNVA